MKMNIEGRMGTRGKKINRLNVIKNDMLMLVCPRLMWKIVWNEVLG